MTSPYAHFSCGHQNRDLPPLASRTLPLNFPHPYRSCALDTGIRREDRVKNQIALAKEAAYNGRNLQLEDPCDEALREETRRAVAEVARLERCLDHDLMEAWKEYRAWWGEKGGGYGNHGHQHLSIMGMGMGVVVGAGDEELAGGLWLHGGVDICE